jgi:glycosyltransferase involved in cell wall biosynthesis
MIKFSVIIPTYNRASFIKKTIASVLNQSYSNFELLVVDDGSSDNTKEIVESIKDPRITYHKKENGERAKARNFGTNIAKGDYVNFLDSDDLLFPNHLEEALKIIESLNSPEVFHLNYDIRDENGNILSKPRKFAGDLNLQMIIKGNLLSCNGVFIRKDIALQNPFNEDRALSASEDYELWLRLAARFRLNYSNTVTSSIVNHDLRSVLNFDKKALIKRLNLFIHYIYSDEVFSSKFSRYKKLMIAHTYSYIALHVSLTGADKIVSIKYLLRSVFKSYSTLFSKRFYAIIIKLFTKFRH